MAYDFPQNPNVGDTFVTIEGTIYTWNGYGWTASSGGGGSGSDGTAYTKAESDAKYVELIGDTMTGHLKQTGTAPWFLLNRTASGLDNGIVGLVNNANRWAVKFGTMAPETGANAGSDFAIESYDDSGGLLSIPVTIVRSTGAVTFRGSIDTDGALNVDGESTFNARIHLNRIAAEGGYSTFIGGAAEFRAYEPNLVFTCTGAPRPRVIWGGAANGPRWAMALGSEVAETGGNVGSEFRISAYGDDGSAAPIHHPLTIPRSHGYLQIIGIYKQGVSEFWDGAGNLAILNIPWCPGGGPWQAYSDERIKTVKGDYAQGLDAIKSLNPVRYEYKNNDTAVTATGDSAKPHESVVGREFVGLVAQQVETTMPEMVKQVAGTIDGEAVTDLRTLDTGPLVFALVNAVKELSAVNDTAMKRIGALEKSIAALAKGMK